MEKKVIIQLDNGELDISKEIGFGLQYSIGEIQDPSKRDSPYSKTITLPGNKNNNYLLGNLYDINETFTFFNPNIKVNAKIVVNSSVVLNGYLKLKNIKINREVDQQGNYIEYEVEIFDIVSDLYTAIGDKYLTELDFSEYDHTYSFSAITNSWYHSAEDGYMYPNLYKNTSWYETADFKPALYHKKYLEKIIEGAGFSVSGTLMDTGTTNGYHYDKEIIPFNGDLPTLTTTEIDRRKFRASMGATTAVTIQDKTILGGVSNSINNVISLAIPFSPFTYFNDDSTSPNFDNGNHWNTSLNQWTIDANGRYDLRGRVNVIAEFKTHRSDVTNISGASSHIFITFADEHKFVANAFLQGQVTNTTNYNVSFGSNPGNASFIYDPNQMGPKTIRLNGIPYVGDEFSGTLSWEAFQGTYTISSNIFTPPSQNPILYNRNWSYRYGINAKKNGSNIHNFSSQSIKVPTGTGGPNGPNPAFNAANNYEVTQSHVIDLNKYNIPLLTSDVISFEDFASSSEGVFGEYLIYANRSQSSIASAVPVLFSWKIVDELNSLPSLVYNSPGSTNITDGDTIFLNNYIPKEKKQIDILTDLVKRKNVFISRDKDNEKKVIIDTRDDYYAKGGTLDWTDKEDLTFDRKIVLISELQNKEILFTYKKDSDGWNNNYTASVDGDIYGQERVIFDNQFIVSEKKVESPFSPTPLIYENLTWKSMIVPAIPTASPKSNLRVLYSPGTPTPMIRANDAWRFKWVHATNGVTYSYINTYGYAGHYDDPINPTIDINFGEVPFEYYTELENITNNTEYNLHWSNYMRQISEGRMVTTKFWLDEVDISFIKDNLNYKIWVKDAFFYINKIQDFNPAKSIPTTVELIKIVDGVAFNSEITNTRPKFTAYEAGIKSSITTDTGGSTGQGTQTGYDNESNTVLSQRTNISGQENYVGVNSERTMVMGNNNTIMDNSSDVGIIGGSGNTIYPGLTNSWIIGNNNKTITESNEMWVGDFHIKNGAITPGYNLIDGQENQLFNLYPTYTYNLIDGGEDEQRAYNSENTINLIDGGEDAL